ncbi:hypothetical protein AX774_g6151, partial [Zancudomyces culisetae]
PPPPKPKPLRTATTLPQPPCQPQPVVRISGGYVSNEYPSSIAAKPNPFQSKSQKDPSPFVAQTLDCSTCGCDEFVEHPFKRGSCNNCFHKH